MEHGVAVVESGAASVDDVVDDWDAQSTTYNPDLTHPNPPPSPSLSFRPRNTMSGKIKEERDLDYEAPEPGEEEEKIARASQSSTPSTNDAAPLSTTASPRSTTGETPPETPSISSLRAIMSARTAEMAGMQSQLTALIDRDNAALH